MIRAALLLVLVGCSGPARTTPRKPPPPPPPHEPLPTPTAPEITWARVTSIDTMPPVPADTWRLHLIDVGTGLAILIQGHDFAMLYDAGTNDPSEKPARVLAYLDAAGVTRLDHVVLSHPHLDHASALEDVLFEHEVGDIWDSGRINQAVFYRDFLAAVARSTATYHTAAPPPDDRTLHVKDVDVTIDRPWQMFSEGDDVALGDDARFTILHADYKTGRDPNQSSIVLAVSLGGVRVLLTGDAESGDREDPSAAVGDVEEYLVDHGSLDADILQVGHHGSKTSSRRAFLAAVTPTLALVSAGPKAYGKVVLPDAEVIAALEDVGAEILRTDLHDDACDLADRLGPTTGPGGCDSYVVTITAR